MEPIQIAVIGAGYWGPNLIRNFTAHPDTNVRWVCDLSASTAARSIVNTPQTKTTTSFEDVLADPLVDAIAIATPAGTHAGIGLAAISAGKHVLIEKPLARTVQDGEQLVKSAEDAGVVLMTDHTFCYTGAVRKIAQLVSGGTLGDIQYYDSVRINLGLIQSDIDVFWDLAPHDLSILDFILPKDIYPTAVAAHGADPLGVGHPCVGFFSMPLSNGGIAHAHVNWLSPTKVRTTTLGASKKMLLWDDLRPSQRLSVFDTRVDLNDASEQDQHKALVSYRTGDMIAPILEETEALHEVAEEFVTAIRQGRTPLTDGHSGLRVLKALEGIQTSLANGGALIPLDVA